MDIRELEDAVLALDYVGEAVECRTCGNRKAPRGRCSGALEASLCNDDCVGYGLPPKVGGLHPGESAADFGYEYVPFDTGLALWKIIRGIRERREEEEEEFYEGDSVEAHGYDGDSAL